MPRRGTIPYRSAPVRSVAGPSWSCHGRRYTYCPMQRLSMSIFSLVVLAGSAGAQPAPDPQPAPPAPPADQPLAQPEPTAPPAGPPAPVTVAPPPSPAQSEKPPAPSISGKWTTSFYGFAEGDLIYDSVQGPGEAIGNGALPRPAMGT